MRKSFSYIKDRNDGNEIKSTTGGEYLICECADIHARVTCVCLVFCDFFFLAGIILCDLPG